jgi:hypothetical protein
MPQYHSKFAPPAPYRQRQWFSAKIHRCHVQHSMGPAFDSRLTHLEYLPSILLVVDVPLFVPLPPIIWVPAPDHPFPQQRKQAHANVHWDMIRPGFLLIFPTMRKL